jgi:hypothetical protein
MGGELDYLAGPKEGGGREGKEGERRERRKLRDFLLACSPQSSVRPVKLAGEVGGKLLF